MDSDTDIRPHSNHASVSQRTGPLADPHPILPGDRMSLCLYPKPFGRRRERFVNSSRPAMNDNDIRAVASHKTPDNLLGKSSTNPGTISGNYYSHLTVLLTFGRVPPEVGRHHLEFLELYGIST
jgi:hypothetical protein